MVDVVHLPNGVNKKLWTLHFKYGWSKKVSTVLDTCGYTVISPAATRRFALKADQLRYLLRRLEWARLGSSILTSFYRSVVQKQHPSPFAVRCSSCSRKAQDEAAKSAQQIAGSSVATTEDFYTSRCSSDASCILTDGARPPNTLCMFPSWPAGGYTAYGPAPPG